MQVGKNRGVSAKFYGRKAFSLIELVVAIAILGGVCFGLMSYLYSSAFYYKSEADTEIVVDHIGNVNLFIQEVDFEDLYSAVKNRRRVYFDEDFSVTNISSETIFPLVRATFKPSEIFDISNIELDDLEKAYFPFEVELCAIHSEHEINDIELPVAFSFTAAKNL